MQRKPLLVRASALIGNVNRALAPSDSEPLGQEGDAYVEIGADGLPDKAKPALQRVWANVGLSPRKNAYETELFLKLFENSSIPLVDLMVEGRLINGVRPAKFN